VVRPGAPQRLPSDHGGEHRRADDRAPELRGTTETFASRLFGAGVTRTNALETLAIASLVRGMSTRDVEAALADTLGPEASLSKSTVSTICQAIRTEYQARCERRLHDVELDYLLLDASHSKMHPNAGAEPVLAAWGITTGGKPVFVGLAAAASESTDAWEDLLSGLLTRGLRPPLLVISDGAPGIQAACELLLGRSLRQRCLIHKSRNVLSKLSQADQAQAKAGFWDVFDTSARELKDLAPGHELVAAVQARIDAFAAKWARATGRRQSDADGSPEPHAYLRFPAEHPKRIRHTNFIERTFGESRPGSRSSVGCQGSTPAPRWAGPFSTGLAGSPARDPRASHPAQASHPGSGDTRRRRRITASREPATGLSGCCLSGLEGCVSAGQA
jgi:transposase-like protein